MKYIQSFYQYPVTFSSIGKTIPARNAVGEMKNIAEFTEKELERLQNCEPFFRELLDKKKLRVLNHIPASYVPPAQQVNNAKAEADKAKAEADYLREQNEAIKKELEALKKKSAKEENSENKGSDSGLEGSRSRDAVAGVDEVDETKKTGSFKKGKK